MNSANSSDLTTDPRTIPSNPYFCWALPVLRYLWTQAPKRGLTYYSGLLLVLLLWIVPKAFETGNQQMTGQPQRQTEQRVPSSIALPLAVIAAAGAGFVAEKLNEYSVILDAEQEALSERAIEVEAANTSVRRTKLNADVAHTQHQIYEALPVAVAAQLRPAPQQRRQSAEEEAKDLADSIAGNLKVKGKEAMAEGTASDTTASLIPFTLSQDQYSPNSDGVGYTASYGTIIAASDHKTCRYYRANIRGKDSLCIDLKNEASYCGLPIVDLADDIARDDKTCFLIGITGSGKSQLTARTISLAHQRKPLTDGAVITHKSPNKKQGEVFNYAGLETSDEYWIVAGEATGSYELEQEIEALKSFVYRAIGDLKNGRSYESPSLLVIDEYGNGLEAIGIISQGLVADGHKPIASQLSALYESCVRKIITQGNSNGVRALITSHDSINDELNMSVGQRRNARFVFLGRGAELDSIETTLDPTRKMMTPDESAELRALVSQYKAAHRAMRSPDNVVLALTNVASAGWRLVIVSQDLHVDRIGFTATNPPKGSIGYTSDDATSFAAATEDVAAEDTVTDDDDLVASDSPDPMAKAKAELDALWNINTFSENDDVSQFLTVNDRNTNDTDDHGSASTDKQERDDGTLANEALIGGTAPSWMTYKDFDYLLGKLRDKLATPDGLPVSRFRIDLKPYHGPDGLERLKAALTWLEEAQIIEMETEKPFKLYFLGTEHFED